MDDHNSVKKKPLLQNKNKNPDYSLQLRRNEDLTFWRNIFWSVDTSIELMTTDDTEEKGGGL